MFIKTLLKINDDLKEYLKEEINKTDDKFNQEYAKRFNHDPFDYQWIFKFDNGYGASIIKRFCSFGFDNDLFELGTLAWDGETRMLTRIYALDNEDDIFGRLTNEEVMDLLYKIKNI